MNTHSPLPWKVTEYGSVASFSSIRDARGELVGWGLSRADADHIVEQVNHQVIHLARRTPPIPQPQFTIDDRVPPNTIVMFGAEGTAAVGVLGV